jgi:hypothetical protein
MQFRDITAAHYKIRTKFMNTECGQKAWCFNVKEGGYKKVPQGR